MDNRKLQVIDMLGLNVIEKHPRLCIVKKEESDFYEDRKIVFLQKYERQFDTFCDMDDNRYKFAQLIFSVRELDETAIEILADNMKKRLAKKRAEGYGGWQSCTEDELSNLLTQSLEKGNPVDIANFCAFLLARGFTYKAKDDCYFRNNH